MEENAETLEKEAHMDIEKRSRMAAESILENEAIRDGLDDDGASVLLDWGMACAVRITHDTSQIEDDDEAKEAVYPRMRALREMLDVIKSLCKTDASMNEGVPFLAQLVEKAALVYGENVAVPQLIDLNTFAAIKVGNAGQNISALRGLLEKNGQTQE